MSTDPSTASVILERHVAAPVALVWQLWTDPEHFAAWYGPQGASIPVAEMDLRVGGARRVCMAMQTPDGPMEMWFGGEYVEIVEHERLVYTEFMTDPNGNPLPPEQTGMPAGHPAVTEVRVELAAAGDGTALVLTHAGIPADSPGAMGWTMALDKLDQRVADLT